MVVFLSDSRSKLSSVRQICFHLPLFSLSHCQIIITNWKRCGGKWSWYNLRLCPAVDLEQLRKTTKTYIRIVGVPADLKYGFSSADTNVFQVGDLCAT